MSFVFVSICLCLIPFMNLLSKLIDSWRFQMKPASLRLYLLCKVAWLKLVFLINNPFFHAQLPVAVHLNNHPLAINRPIIEMANNDV